VHHQRKLLVTMATSMGQYGYGYGESEAKL
jgi:hypothetical protein